MATPGKAATIYDVARAAGVSHQTVSRYLQGFNGIRPETRERVELALQELGYKPNLAARFLRTAKSMRIGALAHEMSWTGPSRIMQGAASGAREAGYVLDIVSLAGFDDRSIYEGMVLLADQSVAGIFATAQTDRVIAVLGEYPIEVPVFIDSRLHSSARDGAPTINAFAAELAAAHLLELGHRRIAIVTGPADWVASRDRSNGFITTLAAWGVTPTWVAEGDWLPGSGYEAGMSMPLDLGITAVFAANDDMCLGVMRAFGERGLRVPTDISLIGFDDMPEAAYLTPALTTIRMDFEAEGRFAMRQLVAAIEGRDAIGDEPPAPMLVVRESTSRV